MTDISEIEKTSLEAHVELCAERYGALNDKLTMVVNRHDSADAQRDEILQKLDEIDAKRIKDTSATLVFIIGLLLTMLGYMVVHYVLK